MPKTIFTQELEGTRRRGRPRKIWKEEAERDLQVLGVKRRRELVADKKNGRTLFDRPKPTVGCSANGRRRRRRRYNAPMILHASEKVEVEPEPCHQQATLPVHYTTSCKQGLVFLRMGEIIARNMLRRLKLLINCYFCI